MDPETSEGETITRESGGGGGGGKRKRDERAMNEIRGQGKRRCQTKEQQQCTRSHIIRDISKFLARPSISAQLPM